MLHAAVSDKVKVGKAHGVELCGEKLVLFRGKDGKVCHLQRSDILCLSIQSTCACIIAASHQSLHKII